MAEITCWQDLPCEMQMLVLNMVDLEAKMNGRLVCRKWKEMLNNLVRFTVRHLDTQDTVDKFFASTLDFHRIEVGYIKKSLKFPSATNSRNPMPRSQKIVFKNEFMVSDASTILYFLKYGLVRTESLKIQDGVFNDLLRLKRFDQILEKINWEFIKKLHLQDNDIGWNFDTIVGIHSPIASILQSIHFPNLKTIKFSAQYHGEDDLREWDGLKHFLKKFQIFLIRNSGALKYLHVRICGVPPGKMTEMSTLINDIRLQLKMETDFRVIV